MRITIPITPRNIGYRLKYRAQWALLQAGKALIRPFSRKRKLTAPHLVARPVREYYALETPNPSPLFRLQRTLFSSGSDHNHIAEVFGPPLGTGRFEARLARNKAEIIAAQRLRHRVFFPSGLKKSLYPHQDRDDLDAHCDHLIVIDKQKAKRIVGVYRLIRQAAAEKAGGFYSAAEYDLSPLLTYSGTLLELGRSCIDPAHRDGTVMRLLWKGLSRYIARFNIDLMFGCASFPGTQTESLAESLSYLHYFHKAPPHLSPHALSSRYEAMNLLPRSAINPKAAFSRLPPLIKAYLRIGGEIGQGAVIDTVFQTTDVFVIVQTHRVMARYRDMGIHHQETISPEKAPS